MHRLGPLQPLGDPTWSRFTKLWLTLWNWLQWLRGGYEEHALSICATPWQRLTDWQRNGAMRERRVHKRMRNEWVLKHFLLHEAVCAIKSGRSKVSLGWHCGSNLNYPLSGYAGPEGSCGPVSSPSLIIKSRRPPPHRRASPPVCFLSSQATHSRSAPRELRGFRS